MKLILTFVKEKKEKKVYMGGTLNTGVSSFFQLQREYFPAADSRKFFGRPIVRIFLNLSYFRNLSMLT